MKTNKKIISQTLKKHRAKILKKANVVGVGVGEKITKGKPMGRFCLKVYVEKKVGEEKLSKRNLVPPRISDVETDVEEVGKIKPLAYTRRMRPAPAGVSIGHYKITAGTLGCLVRDRKTGGPLILSNNHVLANSNLAKKGDAVIQPGAADGGKMPKDKIGELERWVEIKFKRTPNAVDCAVARPLSVKDVKPEIVGDGAPKRVLRARLGLVVQKTGRTTEFTIGKVRDVTATVKVDYDGRTAIFENQIITSAMSQGGDSGSLVTDQKNRAVGLLFAGSDVVTICNPIPAVFKSLDVHLEAK
jgi:hypothetical protein